MLKQFVIARDANGMALKRLVVEDRGRLIYLANPKNIEAVECGDSFAIGFPQECIYLFDIDRYSNLFDQETEAAAPNPIFWENLTPYRAQ